MAERRVIDQTCPAGCRSGRLDHVGLERPSAGASPPRIDPFSRIDVDKCQPRQHVAHEGLTLADPDLAGRCDARELPLDRPQVFFGGQAKAAQVPPDRAAVGHDPMLRPQFGPPFIQGQSALFRDPAQGPVRHASQLAMPPRCPAAWPPATRWRFKSTMSLANLIEARNGAAAARCV